jgi:hypothetical protein
MHLRTQSIELIHGFNVQCLSKDFEGRDIILIFCVIPEINAFARLFRFFPEIIIRHFLNINEQPKLH